MGLKPTFYDFSLNDGSVVQVTRNYGGLYMLKAQRPDVYEKSQIFNKNKNTDSVDDIELAEVIYAAYVTAGLVNNSIRRSNSQDEEEIMSLESFLQLMPVDASAIENILNKLYGQEKKRADSQRHSRDVQRKRDRR